jgi:hypothetical protein
VGAGSYRAYGSHSSIPSSRRGDRVASPRRNGCAKGTAARPASPNEHADDSRWNTGSTAQRDEHWPYERERGIFHYARAHSRSVVAASPSRH